MSETPPIIEAEDALLDRLAALDLRAAQHVNECLLDTTEPAEVATLALAYARVSRCLRQTLALFSKLKLDRQKAAREAQRHEAEMKVTPRDRFTVDVRGQLVDDRYETVRDAVERVISKAADGDEARHTDFAHRFDREMDDWIDAPDFLERDVETHIQEACRRLGLPDHLARAWRTLPEPTFFPDPEEARDEDEAWRPWPGAPSARRPDDDTVPPDAAARRVAGSDSS